MRRTAILTLAFILVSVMGTMAQSTVQPRITQAVDERMVQLNGNTHPMAQPEYDRGPAPDSLPAERMLLVLQRGPDQEAALSQLLEDQQTKSSPQYHQWLTPAEFGQRFGPADADIAAVTKWLQSQGFRVNRVAAGRTVIEFSGTAGQVRQAFRTEIHKFVVNGEEHWANASDPQIPAALAPVVRGFVSLHNFFKKPMYRSLGTFKYSSSAGGLVPQTTLNTTGGIFYGLGPTDFATIYNVSQLWTAGTDGTGQTIAVVARSNINVQDVRDFRNAFGLPANDPVITLDGPDPGLVPNDESEAVLDSEWSGGVAKGATINLVVSESTEVADGVDLSAFYIIDNNVAGILSESFGQCEASLTDQGNSFYQILWQEAAAEGITVLLASGDNGSAGCDSPFVEGSAGVAVNGLAVSGLASTGFNVAVGGTDFDDVGKQTQYFSSTNTPGTLASALSYIPEKTWNDSCATGGVNGCATVPPSSELSGGSGGPSNCVTTNQLTGACISGRAKPAWQTGTGVPQDGVRDLPDVSFFGGGNDSLSFYLVCEADLDANTPCNLTPQPGQSFGGLGGFVGTSASVQTFAGVMALVQQRMGGRQGNANYVLYPLAAKNPANCNSSSNPDTTNCIFYDTTKGNISMPCAARSPNCSNSATSGTGVLVGANNNPAWLATAGYDRTTGLGTINVANLVTKWSTVSFIATATNLSLGQTNIPVHGTPVTVSIAVTPNSGTAVPTGDVSLLASPGTNGAGIGFFSLNSTGTTTGASTVLLPGGTYTVTAHYAGDGTFGASDSTPPIQVTVGKEASSTFLHLVTNVNTKNPTYTATSTPYGSPYILRADVTNVTDGFQIFPTCSSGCPTGNVMITANGQSLDAGTFKLNSLGYAEDQAIQMAPGNYNIAAAYQGDASYDASNGSLTVNVAKAPTTVTAGIGGTPVEYGSLEEIAADVLTTSSGVPPTGTLTFLDNGAPANGLTVTYQGYPYNPNASPPFYATLVGSGVYPFTPIGAHNLTVQYSGNVSYAGGSSAPYTFTVVQSTTYFNDYGALPNPATPSLPVTISAQIFSSSVVNPPTGTVTFYDNGTPLSGTVIYGGHPGSWNNPGGGNYIAVLTAQLTYTFTQLGTHTITAQYSGDTNFAPSTMSPITLNVNQKLPTAFVNLLTSSNPPAFGVPTTVFATLQGTGFGGPDISGTVTFTDSGAPMAGPVTYQYRGNMLFASLNVTYNALGAHTIVALYSGDSNYAGSQSQISFSIGAPFSLSSTSGTSITLGSSGGSGSINMAVIPAANSTIPVSFSCTSSSQKATCGVVPNSVTLSNGGISSVTVNYTVPALGAQLMPSPRLSPSVLAAGFVVAGVFLFFVPGSLSRRGIMLLILFVGLTAGMIACGGGSGSAITPGGGTTSQTYTFTVTGALGTDNTVTTSASFTVTVQ